MKQKARTIQNEKGIVEKRIAIIEEYYNMVKPDMTYKEFEAVCNTPFRHIKKHMMSGELFDFRLKYFGKFVPRPSTVVWILEYLKKNLDEGNLELKEYNAHILGITRYISENPKPFLKYAGRISRWIDIRNN